MNYDKILSDYFLEDGWRYNKEHKILYTRKKKNLPNIRKYLEYRYNDSYSFKETIMRMFHNIDIRPKCKLCECNVDFIGKYNIIFRQYCSCKCSNKSKETIFKKQQNDRLKNNGKLGWNINNKEKNAKRIKTINERYGGMSYFVDKMKETTIKKYGSISPLNIPTILLKRNETIKLNRKITKSKTEDIAYKLLKEKYIDIKRQYSSEKYPFACDFYIPSLDLYIECHFSHYHQGHSFDITNEDDLKTLEKLKEKSKNNKEKYNKKKSQYDNIIYTWTNLDVRKLQAFKDNNLNYKIFYSLDELKNWL